MQEHSSMQHDRHDRASPSVCFKHAGRLRRHVPSHVSRIDGWGEFRNNINMAYLVLTMAAPMGTLILLTLASMYPNKPLNLASYAGLILVFVTGLADTRAQAFAHDRQFIAPMIPHHSGAILMCREATLRDPGLVSLCADIQRAQRREIQRMDEARQRLRD